LIETLNKKAESRAIAITRTPRDAGRYHFRCLNYQRSSTSSTRVNVYIRAEIHFQSTSKPVPPGIAGWSLGADRWFFATR